VVQNLQHLNSPAGICLSPPTEEIRDQQPISGDAAIIEGRRTVTSQVLQYQDDWISGIST